MDSNSLIYLAFIVEEGSFQAAARKLAMPKSSLSRQIAALETRLGVQLLNRTTRRLSLTEAGAQIFPSCQKLAEEYRHIVDLTQEATSQPRGVVRLTAPVTAGRIFLARWLASFRQRYPDIVLDVHLTDEEQDMVAHRFDLAIRVGPLRSSSLISRPFAETQRILCAAPALLREHRIESISDISVLPAIVFARAGSTGRWALTCGDKKVEIPIQEKLILNDMTSILEAASAGAGIALVPAFVANRYLRDERLVQLLPDCHGERAQFHVVYLKRENLPRKTKLLIEYILMCAQEDKALFEASR